MPHFSQYSAYAGILAVTTVNQISILITTITNIETVNRPITNTLKLPSKTIKWRLHFNKLKLWQLKNIIKWSTVEDK